jgi:SSS family solute:Na+ symporter
MHLSALDIVVVVVYSLIVLAVAQFTTSGKETGDTDGEVRARMLPWWAVGTSLIAANISAEQIIGMSGSAYAFGLAIASYEWMGAITLLVVGKFLWPIFLKNEIHTMPEFLRRRYGSRLQLVMALLWIGMYVFVVLPATLWLGAIAIHVVTGLTPAMSLILLGLFAGNYALYVGLKRGGHMELIQIAMLVVGGLVIVFFALERISEAHGLTGPALGFRILIASAPEHFHVILGPDNPYYKYVPGLSVLFGGMWIVNLSYWGFNQQIIQGVLTAKDVRDVQRGAVFAAFLKLAVPFLVIVPGVAAVLLVPHLSRPDEAYPMLMTILPSGLLGIVFVALVAAIIASMRSTLSSIASIFTQDAFKIVKGDVTDRQKVILERMVAIVALVIAMVAATPLLSSVDQAFQYIQNYNGFFTPGVVVVFLLGLFWKRATEAGALTAAIGSPIISTGISIFMPAIPFMNRMVYVFLITLGLAVAVSLAQERRSSKAGKELLDVDFSTDAIFNIGAIAIIAIVISTYAAWW